MGLSIARRGVTAQPVSGGGSVGTSVDLSTFDIRPYIRLGSTADGTGHSADTEYVIPNGTYTAGDCLNAARSATGGRFNGYVVIRPATMGGATIDQSPPGTALGGGLTANGDLRIGSASSRVVLAGFNVRNGTFHSACPSVKLWDCDLQFPIATWHAEPNIGAGTPTGQYHYAPRCIDLEAGCANFGLYRSIVHNTGTGLYVESGGTDDLTVVGSEFYDFGLGLTGFDLSNIIHPDCMALFGRIRRAVITDSYLHGNGHVSSGLGHEDSVNHTDLSETLARLWITNCGNEAIIWAYKQSLQKISLSLTDVLCWANGTSNAGGTTDAGWQVIQQQVLPPYNGTEVDNFTYSISSFPYAEIVTTTLTGCSSTAGGGTDPRIANPSLQDPGTVWRAAAGHGSTDYVAYFDSLGWAA